MKLGRSKEKGGKFEREVCRKLSLWVTNGRMIDCFWRSAMSGGRATTRNITAEVAIRQAGDITSVAPEGNWFCASYYIECKHVKELRLGPFILSRAGPIAKYWARAIKEADRYERTPWLIAKQNNFPTILITRNVPFSLLLNGARPLCKIIGRLGCTIYNFEAVLKTPVSNLRSPNDEDSDYGRSAPVGEPARLLPAPVHGKTSQPRVKPRRRSATLAGGHHRN